MPLLKLWNAIRGRSNTPASATAPVGSGDDGSPVDGLGKHGSGVKVVAGSEAESSRGSTAASPGRRREGRGKKRLFGGPHAALRKRLKGIIARSVVEVSIGDGTRAAAVFHALGPAAELKYVAIDQFEMGGSELTLKQYHQRLRTEGLSVQVIPDTVEGGLTRVVRTVGQVDLVLLAVPPDHWQQPATLVKLARICHAGTVVLYQGLDESWHHYEPPSATLKRAA